jgi:hypothetical protein
MVTAPVTPSVDPTVAFVTATLAPVNPPADVAFPVAASTVNLLVLMAKFPDAVSVPLAKALPVTSSPAPKNPCPVTDSPPAPTPADDVTDRMPVVVVPVTLALPALIPPEHVEDPTAHPTRSDDEDVLVVVTVVNAPGRSWAYAGAETSNASNSRAIRFMCPLF